MQFTTFARCNSFIKLIKALIYYMHYVNSNIRSTLGLVWVYSISYLAWSYEITITSNLIMFHGMWWLFFIYFIFFLLTYEWIKPLAMNKLETTSGEMSLCLWISWEFLEIIFEQTSDVLLIVCYNFDCPLDVKDMFTIVLDSLPCKVNHYGDAKALRSSIWPVYNTQCFRVREIFFFFREV